MATALIGGAERFVQRGSSALERGWRETLLIVAGSLLVALAARVQVPLQPVPVTLQDVAVLLVGAMLGGRRGGLALVAYLAEGALGLPVFAKSIGPAALLGPTAGYLWAFPLAAYLMGTLVERGAGKRCVSSLLAALLSGGVILLCGWAWLSLQIGPQAAIATGVAPFVLYAALKAGMVACVCVSLGRRKQSA